MQEEVLKSLNKYTDLLMLVFLEAEAFRLHTRPHISLEPGRSVSGTWAILQLRNHRHRGRRLTRNRSNINQRKFHNRPSARTDCTFKVTPRPTDLFTSRAPQVLLRLFSPFLFFWGDFLLFHQTNPTTLSTLQIKQFWANRAILRKLSYFRKLSHFRKLSSFTWLLLVLLNLV